MTTSANLTVKYPNGSFVFSVDSDGYVEDMAEIAETIEAQYRMDGCLDSFILSHLGGRWSQIQGTQEAQAYASSWDNEFRLVIEEDKSEFYVEGDRVENWKNVDLTKIRP